ncbi:MAG TPA: tRNA (adenosine(37)-N6)-threonylcarbamoyltransferase complex dimerization subunit type 1 TsaB [Gemmataceae bacterium]|nr:tRNA (adenosine(37)-N6)-threonylcarbamoyltransferase complex dimerization subunit type 1 TsaB [Gemmataceae bacterium]
MSENWLLIETSGKLGKLGLARGETVVRAAELDASRRHARDLASTVGGMLTAEGLRPADLAGVMVSVGPGSYTGLRVGVMSAKALAYATGARLVAVPTFAAIARRAPAESGKLWVIADALQGQIYLQRFERSSEIPEGPSGRVMAAVDELRIDRADVSLGGLPPGTWVSGPGVKVYADRIPPGCRLVPEADRESSVESLFRAGQTLPPTTREELFRLEPLYLRGSSAEEKARNEKPRG